MHNLIDNSPNLFLYKWYLPHTSFIEIVRLKERNGNKGHSNGQRGEAFKKRSQSDAAAGVPSKKKKTSANLEACNASATDIFKKKVIEMQLEIDRLKEQLEQQKMSEICYPTYANVYIATCKYKLL